MMQRTSVVAARRMVTTATARKPSGSVARDFHASSTVRFGASSFDLPDPSKLQSYHVNSATGTAAAGKKSKWTPQLTKIVATIGPTSEQMPVLQEVVEAGMRVMRLNFSHATREEVELRVTNLSKCKGWHSKGKPESMEEENVRATLLDTRGPEIRCGKLRNDHSGHETISLVSGNTITLRTSPQFAEEGSIETDLFIDYPSLHKSLEPGMQVLLDDGAVILTVTSVESDKEYYGSVECTIENSGELRSRAGVNLPGAETDLP